jgi:hypothetical protein
MPSSILTIEGWRPVKDHGFIGLVGPIYSRKHEDGLEFGFRAQRSTPICAMSCRAGC